MPADARQRERALDPGQSFIVQAPAGSGKTEVLTQRFLKLLAIVERPERVLAITFTRKATQEMRTRISARLAQAEAGERPEADHDRRAVELASRVLERDRALGWDLRSNPGRLRITTIDGLSMQLLSRDPVEGARWSGVQVLENAEPLHREAVRRLFADIDELTERGGDGAESAGAAQDALVRLLVHLGGDSRRLEGLLAAMLARRSLWRRHLETGHAALDMLFKERQRHALDAFEQSLGGERLGEAMAIAERLGSSFGAAGEGIEAQLRRAVGFARLLSTAQSKPRAPGGIRPSLFPGMDEADRPALERLKEIYGQWHASEAARDALERTASWPPLEIPLGPDPLPDTLLDDARTVLSLALFELQSLMTETGQADFTAVTEAALDSLGSDTEPAEALLAEDARIEHILMDEFQDTSATQFQLLRRLTAGWEPGDGRSLLLVGDPMQSIYRFREANVGFFNEVVRQGCMGQVRVEPLSLTSNFRSRAELIDWFNNTFPRVFPARDESDSGAVRYTPVDPEVGAGGAVHLHALAPGRPGEDQGRRVAELVSAALEEDENEKIAILVRSRKQVRRITSELAAAGIDFEAVEMEALRGRPVVLDLLALTRALAHPFDRVAWIALLRAPWCGLRIAEIHAVVEDDPGIEVFTAVEGALGDRRLESASRARLERLFAVMAHARRLAGSHGLARRVEMCWIQLGGPLCCADAVDLENAETFLELLEEVEQAGGREIVERLEEALENRYAASRPGPIQIMTIHNAKGLEFDVVIIPDLERGTRGSEQPLVAVQEFAGGQNAGGVLMAPLTPAYLADASLYRYLYRVDAERARFESQRVLYVACTRARKRLHLVAEVGLNAKGEPSIPANTFLKFLESTFGAQIASLVQRSSESERGPMENATEPPAQPLLRLAGPLPEPRLGAAGPEPRDRELGGLPDREAVALGTVLHQWLELIHDHPQPGWDVERIEHSAPSIRASLARAGAPQAGLDALQARCIAVLSSALEDRDLMGWIGSQRLGESWSEFAIYRRDGMGFSRHVIDLLARDKAGALRIVDYKTAAPADGGLSKTEWCHQLERYRDLVDKLGAGPVAGAEVRILDTGRRSESTT